MSFTAFKDAIDAISLTIRRPKREPNHVKQLKRFGEAQQDWWQHENVVGICIARKRRQGKLGAYCLQVLVRRKYAKHKLREHYTVPIELACKSFKKPLRTDVRAVGEIRLDAAIATTVRPAQPGYDIGNRLSSSSGTLGCIVIDSTGRRLGLSCAHVLAPNGVSDLTSAEHRVVVCPSFPVASNLGAIAEAPIGTLTAVLVPSFDKADADTNLDIALFIPTNVGDLTSQIADLGTAPTGINDDVRHNEMVHIVGAASARSDAKVDGTHLLAKIPYGHDVAHFSDQIIIKPLGSPGDSGSLVLDEQNRAVGIHIGSSEGMSICTPIRRVLDALNCTLAFADP